MIRIEEPFHGAVLNRRHGTEVEGGLLVSVRGIAPVGEPVMVNGVYARRSGESFSCEVVLRELETDIIAVSKGVRGDAEHRIRVIWDRRSKPRYRFAIDDNIFFLRDIAAKRYASLFDCRYLAGLRDLNRKYRTKIVLNVFYKTPMDDFSLSQFPASYKSEWADNADWLKMAFHAYAEFPDRPYQHCVPEQLAKDFDLVAEEIQRFAGESSYSPTTLIHWGMVHPTAWNVLVERRVTTLGGYFMPNAGSTYTTEGESFDVNRSGATFGYDVNCCLDKDRSEYLSRHDALKDFASGLVFSKVDIVCNNVAVDDVPSVLEPLTKDPNTAEIMDLSTHEQYFWPFYANYRPDHFERLDATIRFCSERGYEPVFSHEGFLGA